MVDAFKRRFAIFCGFLLPLGAAALVVAGRPLGAVAFGVTLILVAADFLWLAHGLGKIMGREAVSRSGAVRLAAGVLLRTLLLLGLLYGILSVLPRESLGVVLGIGGGLMMLAIAGALPVRG